MRVTSNTFPNSLISQLEQLALRQNRLQTQAATGQRLQFPEDDPTAMRRILDLQSESKSLEQYERNISRLQEYAGASYNVMRALKKVSDRAGEIATLADGTKPQEQLDIYAAEIVQLLQQAIELANGKHRGDYLLSGSRTNQPAFAATLDASGNITAVTYQGDARVNENEIADGVTLSVQTLGSNHTGSGPRGLLSDSRTGADFFGHLVSLYQHLRSGDRDAIATSDRANLAQDEDNFLFHFGTNGAVQSRLEASAAVIKSRSISIERLVSNEADADLAQTVVRLTQTQSAYQAALQSGGTILNQSLLDFLR
jgi:flagellar hook-associated protein 3 FlgL